MSAHSISRRRFLAAAATTPLASALAHPQRERVAEEIIPKIPVGLELYSVRNELAKDLTNIPRARIYYTGSNRSANLLRAHRSALSVPRRSRMILLANIVIRLGLLAPRVWISNIVEARASEKRQSTPPAVATSIATEIRLPEFEGER